MTLVIENGTNVTNANSYVSLTDARNYASARGVTLSVIDATLEILAIKAMDYIEAKRDMFKGYKSYTTQNLQWPRTNVYIDGILNEYNHIPKELISAQCQLIIELNNGVDINPNELDYFIKKEKIDVIETEYSEKLNTSNLPTLRNVNNLLSVLFKNNSSLNITRI